MQLSSLFETDQPVALVTGSGAVRVGAAVARNLAERGFAVVIHANRSISGAARLAEELVGRGGRARAVQADIREEAQVRRLIDQASAAWGRLDVLVNCAAIWQRKALELVTADDVREHFAVNTLGTFLCCSQAGQRMVGQATGGVIVNVGDWATVRPYVNYAAYFPSKGAIPTLTRDLAVELGTRNPRVRVNAVLPGPVMLPLDLPAHERAEAVQATLVKREGSPEHVAHAVRFLIENDFVTGVCLPVDGGRTIYSP